MVADGVKFNPDSIEYGFSPYELASTSFLLERVKKHLRPIPSVFEKPEKDSNDALQVIIDENFFNGFIHQYTSIDKMFSLREVMDRDPRMALFKQLLSTTTAGVALPSFKEEFGENRMIDLVGTVSQSFIEEHIDVGATGVTIEKNGNLKI